MHSRFVTRAVAALTAMASLTGASLAGDIAPPPWRGEQNTFYGVWGFPDAGLPDLPEQSMFNPPIGGAISEMVTFTDEDVGPSWNEIFGGRTGVWALPLNSGLTFRVSNYDNDNPVKHIRIQIKYFNIGTQPGFFGRPPLVMVDPRNSDGSAEGFSFIALPPVTEQIDDFGYFLGIFDFIINPNPAFENITVFNPKHIPSFIDQVVIDTWCVPGAPAFSAFGMIGLLALRRRRA